MYASMVSIAAVLAGIDARWPPLPDGGLRYVIQIEPHLLDRLQSGQLVAIGSDVPPYLKEVHAYQITVGTQRLPKDAPGPEITVPIVAGVATEWIALPDGGVQCQVLIEPQVVAELKKPGRAIQGKIPPQAREVRAYKIAVRKRPPTRPEAPNTSPSSAAPPPPVPRPFPVEPNTKPITAQAAVHVEPVDRASQAEPQLPTDSPSDRRQDLQPKEPGEPDKPWVPLTLALFGLFASLGGNVFLLWIAQDFRRRYRALLRRMGETEIEPADGEAETSPRTR